MPGASRCLVASECGGPCPPSWGLRGLWGRATKRFLAPKSGSAGGRPRSFAAGRASFAAVVVAFALACGSPAPTSRAALLVDAGRPEAAQELLEEHLRREPEDTDARRHLIRVLGFRGDLGAAEREAAVLAGQLGEADPTPWLELGHAYELAHRFEEALTFYDRAATVAPQDPRGPRVGGTRAARWGELEWAAPRLEEALRRDPEDASSWHTLGLVRVHQGRYEEAKSAYLRGLHVSPTSREHRVGLATLALREGRHEEALHHYEALAAQWPEQGDVHLGRAYVLWRLGRIGEAQAALERARLRGATAEVAAKLERVLRGAEVVRDLPTSDADVVDEPSSVLRSAEPTTSH